MTPVLFGIVVSNEDPDKLGRVQVRLIDYSGDVTLPWLRVLQPLASEKAVMTWVVPEKDDQVVMLQGPGGAEGLIVLGSVHTGKRKPLAMGNSAAGAPTVRGMVTVGGNEIVIDDTKDKESILIRTKDAKVSILLDGKELKLAIDGEEEISLTSKTKVLVTAETVELVGDKEVNLKADKGKVNVTAKEVAVEGKSKVTVKAPSIELG